jgi:hypothetical protein
MSPRAYKARSGMLARETGRSSAEDLKGRRYGVAVAGSDTPSLRPYSCLVGVEFGEKYMKLLGKA